MHYQRWQRHGDPLIAVTARVARLCSVEGCDGKHQAHGLCFKHYVRLRNGRDLHRPTLQEMTEEQRFWLKVDRLGATECWPWTGANNGRYGTFPGGGHGAHRYSYALAKGAIPVGLTIDHLCGVTLCVNPAHLEAVTQGENNRRARQRERA